MAALLLLRSARPDSPGAVPLGEPQRGTAGERPLVGRAVRIEPLLPEAGYRTVLDDQFFSVTPENAKKWAILEPERGKIDPRDADRLVGTAAANDQAVRGHTLVWCSQNPTWVEKLSACGTS